MQSTDNRLKYSTSKNVVYTETYKQYEAYDQIKINPKTH